MHDAFGIFHLIFSDHGWLWVTETVECRSKDKVGYSITSAFWTNEKKLTLGCYIISLFSGIRRKGGRTWRKTFFITSLSTHSMSGTWPSKMPFLWWYRKEDTCVVLLLTSKTTVDRAVTREAHHVTRKQWYTQSVCKSVSPYQNFVRKIKIRIFLGKKCQNFRDNRIPHWMQ